MRPGSGVRASRAGAFVGHAFIDWDDTLKKTNALYDAASLELAERIRRALAARARKQGGEEAAGAVPSVEQLIRAAIQLDLALSRRHGLDPAHYGAAWVEVYRGACSRVGACFDPEVAAWVRSRADQVALEPQPDVEGAEGLLSWLREAGWEVNAWTAGDPEIQRRKIERSGWMGLFHNVFVVPHKSPERLLRVLGRRDPQRTVVIGNSPVSDIAPALALKVLALHVPGETWAYDHDGELDTAHPCYVRLGSLAEVRTFLEGRIAPRRRSSAQRAASRTTSEPERSAARESTGS